MAMIKYQLEIVVDDDALHASVVDVLRYTELEVRERVAHAAHVDPSRVKVTRRRVDRNADQPDADPWWQWIIHGEVVA